MGENLSLFGWPIPEPREKAGRPEHVPTEENRLKVMMFLALKRSNSEIASALGVSQPTLRKHYFQELGQRRVARLQLEAQRFAAIYERAIVDKDVPALKELGKILERHDLVELNAKYGSSEKVKPPKRGKKEQAQIDAEAVGDATWGDDLRPGAGKPN